MLKRLHRWWNFRRAVTSARRTDPAATAAERDVALLPCWRRPEFLWHCLENLTQAESSADLHVIIRPDTGYSTDILEVARGFSHRLPSLEICFPPPAPFRRTKQSANVLLGYMDAARKARRFVFMIEEDIMIARDFFRWHREAHATAGELFCSISTRNPNRKLTLAGDLDAYYLSSGDYCSNGVCFDKQMLRKLLAPHLCMHYFRKPKRYIRRHFPASGIGLGFVEQDGLIRRIQERSDYPIAWPCVPRAFHSGFYGYNRPGGIAGSLQERVQILAETIYDPKAMHAAAGGPEFVESTLPCDLQTSNWKILRRVDVPTPPTRA